MAFGGTNSPAGDPAFNLKVFIDGETGGDVVDDMAPSPVDKGSKDLGWGLGKHRGMYPMPRPK